MTSGFDGLLAEIAIQTRLPFPLCRLADANACVQTAVLTGRTARMRRDMR